MVEIRLAGVSDWTRLACMDPSRLAEMHENARELRAIVGDLWMENIDQVSTAALNHLRARLVDAGIIPRGVVYDDEPEKLTKVVAKQNKAYAVKKDEQLLYRANRIESSIERVLLKGNRPTNRGKKGRLSRAQRKRFNLPNQVPVKGVAGKVGIAKREGIIGVINCSQCGFADSLREMPHGVLCLGCGWGKDMYRNKQASARGGGSLVKAPSQWRHWAKEWGRPVRQVETALQLT